MGKLKKDAGIIMKERTCVVCGKEIPSEDFEFCPYCSNPIVDMAYIKYFNQGIKYHKQGKNEEAIKTYTKGLSLNPNDSDILFNRGNVYHDMEKYDKALEDFNKAIEINPDDNADLYTNRGVVYYSMKEYARAIEDYNKAIEINPDDSDIYNNRADAYKQLGETDKAFRDYERALEIKTNEISSKSDDEEELEEDENNRQQERMRLCQNCGASISISANVCSQCGSVGGVKKEFADANSSVKKIQNKTINYWEL